MPQISIIMPLFNAQKYLEESLKSVLNQTYSDYELICINDASNDNTKKILKKYQKIDSRIKILENRTRLGAAYSRNKGIGEAKGKYIIFLDGDDIFEEEMLSVTYKTAENHNTDVLIFGYKHIPSSQIHNKLRIVHGDEFIKRYCKTVFSVEKRKPYEFLLWSTSPWNKLFNKSFIVNNKIFFQSLSCANDIYFSNMALMLSKRTLVLDDDRVMIYARDHREPSRISTQRDPMCSYKAYEHLLNMLLQRGILDRLYSHFFYKAFFSFKYALEQTKDINEARCFYDFLRQEGIPNLQKLSKQFFQNDSYLAYLYELFEKNVFETKWYEEKQVLNVYLRKYQEEFNSFFMIEGKYVNVALWGAGHNGRVILQECNEQKLPVKYVVDSSIQKQGEYIEEYCIMDPGQVVNDVDIIIISAQCIGKEVREFVNRYNKEIKVIDITSYFAII